MAARRIRWGGTAAAVLTVLAVTAACDSGKGADPSPTTGSPPGPDPVPAARPADGNRSVQSGPRAFTPQIPRTRPGHAEVAATVDPANPADPWPSERLAEAAERFLEGLLRRVIAGDEAGLRGMVTREVSGRVTPDLEETLEGAALWARLRPLIAVDDVPIADVVIEVDVVDVTAPALRGEAPGDAPGAAAEGRTVARVRIGTAPEARGVAARTQLALELDVVWRLARRSRVAALEVTSLTRVTTAPAFRDVTDAVLDLAVRATSDGGGGLELGALEAVGRTDRISPAGDVYLAMHGAAAGDLDGDGWDDLVVGRSAGQPNLLFMNRQGRLVEEGPSRGLDLLDDTGGMLVVDLDGDGARDVVFGRSNDVVVAWNAGGGGFESFAVLSKEGGDRVYSIAAADVDSDGDLDLYDTRYFASGGYGAQAPTPYHDAMNGAPNVFWRNLLVDGVSNGTGARQFRDDTAAVGLDAINDRFSLASTFDDFDGDGDLDLYVTNDFGRNSLYLWEGTRFAVADDSMGLVDKAAGMGISVADVDLDGRTDLVVSNMHSAAGMRVTREPAFGLELDAKTRREFQRHARGNSLFRGVASGRYEDVTDRAGAGPGGWAWGARFVDWDRDGYMDIVVPNGFLSGRKGPDLQSFFWRRVVGSSPASIDAQPAVQDRYLLGWSVISHLSQFERQHWNAHERTFAYSNGGEFRFVDVSLASGLGFADDGRALVPTDYDQDGRVDLIFRNRTSPTLRVMQGIASGGQWISLRLEGPPPNGDAIGAWVTVTAKGTPRSQRVRAGDGFLGGATTELFFGLGDAREVEAVRVIWPDGTPQSFDTRPSGDPLLGGAWTLVRGDEAPRFRHRGRTPRPAPGEVVATPRPAATPGPPAERVALFDEFPLGAWRLPYFDARPRRVDEASGELGTLVVLWSAATPDSIDALSALAAAEGSLMAAGLRIHPISLDGVREEQRAEELARSSGLRSLGGRMDRSGRIVLDLILARTLAPFDDLPLPMTLLFDVEGDLAVIRVGALGAGAALADARILATRADGNSTAPALGGRWLDGQPKRPLADVPDKLDQLGLTELADHLRAR